MSYTRQGRLWRLVESRGPQTHAHDHGFSAVCKQQEQTE